MAVAMIASLFWRGGVSLGDYVAQGSMLLLVLVLPFVADLDRSYFRYLVWLVSAMVVWGIWRIAHFDRVTGNDPGPDVVYLLSPILYGFFSWIIFVVRLLVVRFFL